MTDPRDDELSAIYGDAKADEPPGRLDDAILAASRRAVGSGPHSVRTPWSRWAPPLALAATVLITATVTVLVVEEQPALDTRELSAPSVPPEQSDAPQGAGERKQALPKDTRRQRENDRAPVEPQFAPDPAPRVREEAREAVREAPAERPRDVPAAAPAAPAAPVELSREAPAAAPARSAPAPAAQSRIESSRDARAVAPAPAAKPRPDLGPRVGALDSQAVRRPEEWIELIRRLKAEGRTVEAERELKEFRSRYPEYRLPDDLR